MINESYDLSGGHYCPDDNDFNPGIWKLSNQTSNDHIDTDLDQVLQLGASAEGEILRGTGTKFTVYIIVDVTQWECTERCILLVDGAQDNTGDITAACVFTPPKEPARSALTIGYLELTLIGAANAAVIEGDGASLIEGHKDALGLPSERDIISG